MSNILSQDEIDLLLGAISSGEISGDDSGESGGATVYDHNRPPFLSDTSLDHFNTFFNQLTLGLEPKLTELTGAPVSLSLTSVDMLLFDEFIRSVPNPTAIFTMKVSDIGPWYVEVDPGASWRLLHAGAGTFPGEAYPGTPLHPLELSLLGRLLLPVWDGMQKSLSAISKLKLVGLQIETNPQAVVSPPDSQALLATMELKIGDDEWMLNMAMPRNLVELLAHYLEQYNVGYYLKPEPPKPKSRTWSRTMRLNLDMGKLELDDLSALQSGDQLIIHEIEEKKFRFRLQG